MSDTPVFYRQSDPPESSHPEETLRQFAKFLREVPARYAYLQALEQECNDQTQDLLHFIELTGNKNASQGYAIYKKLSEIRRERRSCKEELELLAPVMDYIHDLGDLNRFLGLTGTAQGKCRQAREALLGRTYRPRTHILDEFLKGGDTYDQE